jgi:hypothetical protein
LVYDAASFVKEGLPQNKKEKFYANFEGLSNLKNSMYIADVQDFCGGAGWHVHLSIRHPGDRGTHPYRNWVISGYLCFRERLWCTSQPGCVYNDLC